jgi:hypothetical protein
MVYISLHGSEPLAFSSSELFPLSFSLIHVVVHQPCMSLQVTDVSFLSCSDQVLSVLSSHADVSFLSCSNHVHLPASYTGPALGVRAVHLHWALEAKGPNPIYVIYRY